MDKLTGDTAMTPEQLAAIAARNAARTPGKWTQHLVDDTTVVCRGQDICCTFPGGGLDDDVDFNTDTEQRELDAAFIAHASEDIPSLLSEVARLIAALAEAEKLIYAPGLWHCPKCNFTLMQSNLNAVDGTVTARDTPGDKCPNCQSPLWRVSWKQEATKAREVAEQYFDEKKEAEKRGYDAAKEQAAKTAKVAWLQTQYGSIADADAMSGMCDELSAALVAMVRP